MPVLKNPKHELFAQALAKGETAQAAYVSAGYKPNQPHASRLASNGMVSARVAEIQSRAAARVELTQATAIERLMSIADRAAKINDTPAMSVERQSIMDACKVAGLITDKTRVKHDFSDLTDEQLAVVQAALTQDLRQTAETDAGLGVASV